MKKLAFSALVIGSALSTIAHAQTTVTVYGVIDESLAHVSGGNPKGSTTLLAGGGNQASRLGFMGKEDLGGGLSTIFVLENGFNATNGAQSSPAGSAFSRKSYVGLTGNFGTAIVGHMYTLSYTTMSRLDAMDGIAGGDDNMFSRGGTRRNDVVQYTTPTVGGFYGAVAYSFPQAVQARGTEALISYENGPVNLKLLRNDQNGANSTQASPTVVAHNTFLGGAYDFGIVKAFFEAQDNRGAGSDHGLYTQHTDILALGLTAPVGAHGLVGTTYTVARDQSGNNGAKQYAASYQYFLSKRTSFYTAYVHIVNQSGLITTPGASFGTPIYTTAEAAGTTEFEFGILHKF
ncbi:MAG: porin [Herbaspirillum sp.]|jgi:predicted porin|nr:porin [Herbaspirillum sp.]